MDKKFYDLVNMDVKERKDLFEKDPKNYVYSVLYDIVDKSYDLIIEHESELHDTFAEVLPFEVLTQLINFMSGIYDIEIIFEHLNDMKGILKEQSLLRKIQ